VVHEHAGKALENAGDCRDSRDAIPWVTNVEPNYTASGVPKVPRIIGNDGRIGDPCAVCGPSIGAYAREARMRKPVRLLCLVIAVASTLSGCVGGVKLRHPATGQEATCGPYALKYGIGYNELDRCLNDYQRQGYQRVAESGGSAPAPATAATTPAPGSTPSQPGLNGTFSGEIAGQARGQAFTAETSSGCHAGWSSLGGSGRPKHSGHS
jgi:hypothetical protein